MDSPRRPSGQFHEGWIKHLSIQNASRRWADLWMTLQGSMLFLFTSERTSRDTMVGTLTLSKETAISNVPSPQNTGFCTELVTMTAKGETKVNTFLFERQNERDLWKAFIIGISQGFMPQDVDLLPGQVRIVQEAIREHHHVVAPPLPPPNSSGMSRRLPRVQSEGVSFSPLQANIGGDIQQKLLNRQAGLSFRDLNMQKGVNAIFTAPSTAIGYGPDPRRMSMDPPSDREPGRMVQNAERGGSGRPGAQREQAQTVRHTVRQQIHPLYTNPKKKKVPTATLR